MNRTFAPLILSGAICLLAPLSALAISLREVLILEKPLALCVHRAQGDSGFFFVPGCVASTALPCEDWSLSTVLT